MVLFHFFLFKGLFGPIGLAYVLSAFQRNSASFIEQEIYFHAEIVFIASRISFNVEVGFIASRIFFGATVVYSSIVGLFTVFLIFGMVKTGIFILY